jgi:hypothetical protein
MAFRYCCFLSYQRGNDLLDRFVRELFQSLSNELSLLTPLPVWFDTARLQAGDSWATFSTDALCGSVCMVPVLTPTYFSQPYCSQEYLVMERIEAVREKTTGRHDGLIIPVVLRGTDRLPQAILQRAFYDFSDYLAFGPRQFRSPKFSQSVSKVASRIYSLCESYVELEASGKIPKTEVDLPSDQEIREWRSGLGLTLSNSPTLEKA